MIETKDQLIESLAIDCLTADGLLTYSIGNDCKIASTFTEVAEFIVGWMELEKLVKFNPSGEIVDKLAIAVNALKWVQIHLKSMENYSLVTGALHHIETELEKIK